MRLLNVQTRLLEEHFQQEDKSRFPKYAILSHTWGDEEVTFEDLQRGDYQAKLGFHKVDGCCQQAVEDGFGYVWVDTCCIDKSSSAELSEAINSMFQWYKNSEICYIYLSDVEDLGRTEDPSVYLELVADFRKSRWFTRGWTLQELLAQKQRRFYDNEWRELRFQWRLDMPTTGEPTLRQDEDATCLHDDTQRTCNELLQWITSIPVPCITGTRPLSYSSVAQIFSWAASRTTTRVEDQAYSLLGLFNVNMPMLYGEGHRATVRLQEEIWKIRPDQTLLCAGFRSSHLLGPGPVASSPFGSLVAAFSGCDILVSQQVTITKSIRGNLHLSNLSASSHMMTHWGLQIKLPLRLIDKKNRIYLAVVQATTDASSTRRVAIPLRLGILENVFSWLPGARPLLIEPSRSRWQNTLIYLRAYEEEARIFGLQRWSVKTSGSAWDSDSWTLDGMYPPMPEFLRSGSRQSAGRYSLPDEFLLVYRDKMADEACFLVTVRTIDAGSDNPAIEVGVAAVHGSEWRLQWGRTFSFSEPPYAAWGCLLTPRRSRIDFRMKHWGIKWIKAQSSPLERGDGNRKLAVSNYGAVVDTELGLSSIRARVYGRSLEITLDDTRTPGWYQ